MFCGTGNGHFFFGRYALLEQCATGFGLSV